MRGQLDMAEAAGAAAAFTAVVARGPQIIVDLAGLEFIDSSGVAALVRGRNLARQAGGELLLAAPRQQVLRVLPSPGWSMSSLFMRPWPRRPGTTGACRCCRGGAAWPAGRAPPCGQEREPCPRRPRPWWSRPVRASLR